MVIKGVVGNSWRSSPISEKIRSMVVPACRARAEAAWITGPSAMGSENGMPNSMRSAPLRTAARTHSNVVAISGSPQVKKGMKALRRVKAEAMRRVEASSGDNAEAPDAAVPGPVRNEPLVMQILSSVAGNGRHIFVTAPRDRDDDDLVLIELRGSFHCVGKRVRRLDGGNDSLGA